MRSEINECRRRDEMVVVFGDSGQLVKEYRGLSDDGTRSDLIGSPEESAAVGLVESWGDCCKTLLMVHVRMSRKKVRPLP